eukprot:CAMPEP_0201528196 /NCGR_PEP_ID=MMETSP0161_2-20130828/37622_1 /ASSEMBLY_ACC=CAM_ASM_000251 /TAXON_ID=180227 /ORGANISM="Neoparamoeba aestuarina, Strain SoJaBio B1-5/56/2" /LENGTH=310 /DNA_ID=CAMNT_0047929377 /DNA_START=40 /DNA_END=969 /DNA_ORIENTATION=+
MVESATSEVLKEPDWGLIMGVVDRLNQNPLHAKEACSALKKRLKHKSVHVQLSSLALLDALMRSCHAVIVYVDGKEFQKTMSKLGGEKGSGVFGGGAGGARFMVRDKTLDLLRMWGEAYLKDPHLFPAPRIYETYATLKKGGAPFPKEDEINSPPYTVPPKRKPGSRPPQRQMSNSGGTRGGFSREEYGRAAPRERGYYSNPYPPQQQQPRQQQCQPRVVRETVGSIRQKADQYDQHCTLLLEILSAIDIRKENPQSNEMAKEMMGPHPNIKKQIQKYLPVDGLPAEIVTTLLGANEKCVLIDIIWEGLL